MSRAIAAELRRAIHRRCFNSQFNGRVMPIAVVAAKNQQILLCIYNDDSRYVASVVSNWTWTEESILPSHPA